MAENRLPEDDVPEETRGTRVAWHSRRVVPALVLGLSIGWLIGLSESEIVTSAVAALLALIGGIGAGLFSAVRTSQGTEIDLWPVAMIGFGIALGASAGVYARSHQWLAADDAEMAATRAGSGSLYADHSERCERIRAALDGPDDRLRGVLAIEFPRSGSVIVNAGFEPTTLRHFAEDLCGAP